MLWSLLTLSSGLFMLGMLVTGVIGFISQNQRWVWASLLSASLGGWVLIMVYQWMRRNDIDSMISLIVLIIALAVILSGVRPLIQMFRHGPQQFMAMVTLASGIIAVVSFVFWLLFT